MLKVDFSIGIAEPLKRLQSFTYTNRLSTNRVWFSAPYI